MCLSFHFHGAPRLAPEPPSGRRKFGNPGAGPGTCVTRRSPHRGHVKLGSGQIIPSRFPGQDTCSCGRRPFSVRTQSAPPSASPSCSSRLQKYKISSPLYKHTIASCVWSLCPQHPLRPPHSVPCLAARARCMELENNTAYIELNIIPSPSQPTKLLFIPQDQPG